eukprot:760685-Rhodomonas_salina.2
MHPSSTGTVAGEVDRPCSSDRACEDWTEVDEDWEREQEGAPCVDGGERVGWQHLVDSEQRCRS